MGGRFKGGRKGTPVFRGATRTVRQENMRSWYLFSCKDKGRGSQGSLTDFSLKATTEAVCFHVQLGTGEISILLLFYFLFI